MAIELVDISIGTYGDGTTLGNKQAVWDEASSFVDQIGEILLMSGIFDDVEYEKPARPTAEAPNPSNYSNATYYKVWGIITDNNERKRILSIGPNAFTNTNPTPSIKCEAKGTRVTIAYKNGEATTLALSIDKGYGGTASTNVSSDLVYVTSNGILMRSVIDRARNDASAEVTKNGVIMIAKSNGKYPVICIAQGGSSANQSDAGPYAHNGCTIACYSDEAVISTPRPTTSIGPTSNTKDYFRFATSAKQSELVPFAAYGKTSEFTFTPYGFWMPVASATIRNGGWKKVHIDGKNYATDGYWALRDG